MDRVQQAAANVLKEHQAGIRVDADVKPGGWMAIRPISKDRESLDELQSAIAAMGARGPSYELGIDEYNTIIIRGQEYYHYDAKFAQQHGIKATPFKTSIGELANKLADAGVNFPSSEAHRSKTV